MYIKLYLSKKLLKDLGEVEKPWKYLDSGATAPPNKEYKEMSMTSSRKNNNNIRKFIYFQQVTKSRIENW